MGHVADGEAQGLDFGESLTGWRHRWRQVRPEVLQGFGQIPHPQLLSLTGCMALLAWVPGPGPSGAGAGGCAGLQGLWLAGQPRCRRAAEDEVAWRSLLSSSSLEGHWREAEGVHRRSGGQAAAGAGVPRVHRWIKNHVLVRLVQQGLAIEERRAVLELQSRAVGNLHCLGSGRENEEEQGAGSIYEVGGARLHLRQPPLAPRSSRNQTDT